MKGPVKQSAGQSELAEVLHLIHEASEPHAQRSQDQIPHQRLPRATGERLNHVGSQGVEVVVVEKLRPQRDHSWDVAQATVGG